MIFKKLFKPVKSIKSQEEKVATEVRVKICHMHRKK